MAMRNNGISPGGTQSPGTSGPAIFFRRMWGVMAGMMMGGKRDLYNIFGYNRIIDYSSLRDRFQRQDIVKRIVEMPVQAIWDFPPELDADFNTARVIDAMQDFDDRLDIYQAFSRADKLLSFGRFSVIVLGLPGPLDQQVPMGLSAKDLVYIQPYGERDISMAKFDTDQYSPNFGMPLHYMVNVKTQEDSVVPVRVHHSRVIHVVDSPLEHNLIGIPRLEFVYNLLDDILKVAGGSAELFWILANRGMQVNVDKDMDMTTEDQDDLQAELDEYSNDLRRYIRTRGVEVKPLGSSVADPTGTFRVLIGLLASATGIPQRILMGSEAGQLASEQDRANWAETVDKRRTNFALPSILKPFSRRMTEFGIFTQKMPIFKWGDAFHQNPLERAQTMAQFARAAVNLSRQHQFGNPITSMEEARLSMGLEKVMSKNDTPFKPMPEPAAPTGGNKSLPGKEGEKSKEGKTSE